MEVLVGAEVLLTAGRLDLLLGMLAGRDQLLVGGLGYDVRQALLHQRLVRVILTFLWICGRLHF